jgi:hypothetical protein
MRAIWNYYNAAWRCLLLNWRILILLYGFSVGFAFLAIGPFSNLIEYVFGDSLMLSSMTSQFDYTAIADMINHSGDGVQLSISTLLSFFLVYILWSAFYTGGIVELSMHKNTRSSTQVFWKGGAEYFFRYLRLSVYVIVILGVIFSLMFIYFSKDGLNPLHLESEDFLIFRFKFLVAIMAFVFFITSTFRDVAKVIIRDVKHLPIIAGTNVKALSQAFTWRFIALSLINLFFLGLGFLLYLLLKNMMSNTWMILVLSQIFLIYRLAYRFVRLASFNYQYIDVKAALPLHNQSAVDRA